MKMNLGSQNIVVVGSACVGKTVLETLHAQGVNNVVIIDNETAKEKNLAFKPESYLIKKIDLPEIQPILFSESTNYINGKKLPRKKRK